MEVLMQCPDSAGLRSQPMILRKQTGGRNVRAT
jgi:hypothetical protein